MRQSAVDQVKYDGPGLKRTRDCRSVREIATDPFHLGKRLRKKTAVSERAHLVSRGSQAPTEISPDKAPATEDDRRSPAHRGTAANTKGCIEGKLPIPDRGLQAPTREGRLPSAGRPRSDNYQSPRIGETAVYSWC